MNFIFLLYHQIGFFLVPGMSKQMFDVCMLLCVYVFMHDQKGIWLSNKFALVTQSLFDVCMILCVCVIFHCYSTVIDEEICTGFSFC
jgi:hypothetical protein